MRLIKRALSPSEAWISSTEQVVNSREKTVPVQVRTKGLMFTATSLILVSAAILLPAEARVGTSLIVIVLGRVGIQDVTLPMDERAVLMAMEDKGASWTKVKDMGWVVREVGGPSAAGAGGGEGRGFFPPAIVLLH